VSILLLFTASVASIDYNKVEQAELLPNMLRGAWDLSIADCVNEDSTSRMGIGANWIAFHEGYGLLQISTAAGIPDDNQSLAVRFVMSGEGSTWDHELVFSWNEGRPNELFLIEAKSPENMDRDRTRDRYIRCT